ncbi:hypothetical protein A4A49_53888 [Nicotiana attenuata]|uniref:Uncharacterized protein n=1 Tax=Nicotiana attenuata TaxID=49451 RepID=A0A1J6JJA0_NICAT|nr:hypothetical protein A4A49_53888 [Nicotiana attenuata]
MLPMESYSLNKTFNFSYVSVSINSKLLCLLPSFVNLEFIVQECQTWVHLEIVSITIGSKLPHGHGMLTNRSILLIEVNTSIILTFKVYCCQISFNYI